MDDGKNARFTRIVRNRLQRYFVLPDEASVTFEQASDIHRLWGQVQPGSKVLYATNVAEAKRREEFHREPRRVRLDLSCSGGSCKAALFITIRDEVMNQVPSWYHFFRNAPRQQVESVHIVYNKNCSLGTVQVIEELAMLIREDLHQAMQDRYPGAQVRPAAEDLQPAFA